MIAMSDSKRVEVNSRGEPKYPLIEKNFIRK